MLVHPNIVATFAAFTTAVSAPPRPPTQQQLHSSSQLHMPNTAGGAGGGTGIAPSSGHFWMGGAGSVASCSSAYTTLDNAAQGQRPSQVVPGRASGSGGAAAAAAAAAAGLLQRGKTSQKWRMPHESSLTGIPAAGSPAADGGGSGSFVTIISPGAIAAAAMGLGGVAVGSGAASAAAAPALVGGGHGGGGAPSSSPRCTTRMGAVGSLGRFPLSRQLSTLSRVSHGMPGQQQQLLQLPPSLTMASASAAGTAHYSAAAGTNHNGTAPDGLPHDATAAAAYPPYRRASSTISGCVPSSYLPAGDAAAEAAAGSQHPEQQQQVMHGSRSQQLVHLDTSALAAAAPGSAAAGPQAAVSSSGQLGAFSPVRMRSGTASTAGLFRPNSTTTSNSGFAPGFAGGGANATGGGGGGGGGSWAAPGGHGLPPHVISPSPRPQSPMRCGSLGDMSFSRFSGGYAGNSGHIALTAAASTAAAPSAGYGLTAASCGSPMLQQGSPGMPPPLASAAPPPPRATRWETFIVMELCPCGSLRSALDAKLLHDKRTGAPKLHEVLPLAWEVACALQYLHANGVLHWWVVRLDMHDVQRGGPS